MMLGQKLLPIITLLLMMVPRWLAPIWLLAGVYYTTMSAGFYAGSLNLQPLRFLIFAGLIRVMLRGEAAPGFPAKADWAMLLFLVLNQISGIFHQDILDSLVFRAGFAVDAFGSYYLFRCWFQNQDDLVPFFKGLLLMLVPLAICMTFEKATGRNVFSLMGDVPADSIVRAGHLRAQGPFRHPISAGTVAAVQIPLAIVLWRVRPWAAKIGLLSALLMVFDSGSSGPLLSTAAVGAGLVLWRYHGRIRMFLYGGVAMLIALHIVMKAPVWFIIARVNIVGGSTGWHRAQLIDATIKHFNEWWFWGTDVTRHWMPTGVSWSGDHTDITNYFIKLGVLGGLPVMLAFIWVLVHAFRGVGRVVARTVGHDSQLAFVCWGLGVVLFSHVVSMIGISYFDQSLTVSLYSVMGIVISMSEVIPAEQPAPEAIAGYDDDYRPAQDMTV